MSHLATTKLRTLLYLQILMNNMNIYMCVCIKLKKYLGFTIDISISLYCWLSGDFSRKCTLSLSHPCSFSFPSLSSLSLPHFFHLHSPFCHWIPGQNSAIFRLYSKVGPQHASISCFFHCYFLSPIKANRNNNDPKLVIAGNSS